MRSRAAMVEFGAALAHKKGIDHLATGCPFCADPTKSVEVTLQKYQPRCTIMQQAIDMSPMTLKDAKQHLADRKWTTPITPVDCAAVNARCKDRSLDGFPELIWCQPCDAFPYGVVAVYSRCPGWAFPGTFTEHCACKYRSQEGFLGPDIETPCSDPVRAPTYLSIFRK